MAASRAPERVEFPGSQGTPLAGRLELPDGEPRGYALFAHCFVCGKDAVAATRISRALTDAGFAVLRFDFTGLGQSGGDFANSNFTSNVEDLVRAAAFLGATRQAPSMLIGHSLGGAAVLAAAERIPNIQAVVTIGAPADPRHVLGLLPSRLAALASAGSAEVTLEGRTFRLGKQFIEDLDAQHQHERVGRLGAALLVLHSPTDQIVSIENARELFDAARHPKSFVALDGADHLLTQPADARFAAAVIAAWATRYIPSPHVEGDEAASPRLEPGTVRVTENGSGPYGQSITTTGHTILADEPEPIGADTGMSPYDLLLAGLGACTSMTLRMYAERKKWPLDRVEVTLRHNRAHAADCATCETRTVAVEQIERTIMLVGDLSHEQRASLLAIADKCPVHRTLHADVRVSTRLAEHPRDGGVTAVGAFQNAAESVATILKGSSTDH